MATDALLYEILINKSKLKPLSSNVGDTGDNFVDIPLNAFSLNCSIKHNPLDTTNQIFTHECQGSYIVMNNIEEFNTYLKTEARALISKFEKTLIGKYA
jgi:hypothetical protein